MIPNITARISVIVLAYSCYYVIPFFNKNVTIFLYSNTILHPLPQMSIKRIIEGVDISISPFAITANLAAYKLNSPTNEGHRLSKCIAQ